MFEFTHRRRIVSLLLGAAVAVALVSMGCVTHHHVSRGPGVYTVKAPPRSATHGYVHHYRDVVLVFDRSWNGYWVRSHPDHYFHSNYYYRWHGGRWHRARHIRGPWVSIELRAVPTGLRYRGTSKQHRNEHRGAVRERREDRREAARDRRDERREAVRERREDRREAVRERRDVVKERREELREVAMQRRDDRRDAVRDRREAVKERREDRREAVKERRDDGREAVKERREVAMQRRDDRREAVRDRLAERREIAESQKNRRIAEASAGSARGSVVHRKRKVRKHEEEDEELSAH